MTAAPLTLDVTSTPPIPFSRIVGVEMRKMTDTRAGRWLLITIVALTALIEIIFFATADSQDRTFFNFMGVTATPQGLLLPVLGILLVTQEWGQRTALTTFSTVPIRSRVIWAKVVAALLFALAALVIALAIGCLATAVGGSDHAWDGVGLDDVGKFALVQFSGIIQGLGFALLWLNTAAAIVTYFVAPQVWSILVNVIHGLSKVGPWLDLNDAQSPMLDGSHMVGKDWWQLLTASLVWIVLPFVVGFWRVLRSELK
ncbi:ABC transporter permease [Nocardioides sp. KR10-350]|uniref:ABC transporter permease n=1 Tax=Nocardioides cheoyonin TaxID=3156615 RepID=UPI0032B5963B